MVRNQKTTQVKYLKIMIIFNMLIYFIFRFNVIHILSNASESWTGHKGRISEKILCEIIQKERLAEGSQFACVCGPTEFTQISLDLLKKFGLKDHDTHGFIG